MMRGAVAQLAAGLGAAPCSRSFRPVPIPPGPARLLSSLPRRTARPKRVDVCTQVYAHTHTDGAAPIVITVPLLENADHQGRRGREGYPKKPFVVAFSGRQLAARRGPDAHGCGSGPLAAGVRQPGRLALGEWRASGSQGHQLVRAARSKCPGSQPPTRPPTTPEAQPLAQGCPLALKGAPQPLGCQRESLR